MPWYLPMNPSAMSASGIVSFGIRTGRLACDAEDRVGAELVEAGPAEVGPGVGVPGDHLAGDPVVGREAVDGDGLGPRGELAGLGDLAVLGLEADLLELVDVAVVADHVGPGRERAEPQLLVVGGERVDGVGHGESPIRRW